MTSIRTQYNPFKRVILLSLLLLTLVGCDSTTKYYETSTITHNGLTVREVPIENKLSVIIKNDNYKVIPAKTSTIFNEKVEDSIKYEPTTHTILDGEYIHNLKIVDKKYNYLSILICENLTDIWLILAAIFIWISAAIIYYKTNICERSEKYYEEFKELKEFIVVVLLGFVGIICMLSVIPNGYKYINYKSMFEKAYLEENQGANEKITKEVVYDVYSIKDKSDNLIMTTGEGSYGSVSRVSYSMEINSELKRLSEFQLQWVNAEGVLVVETIKYDDCEIHVIDTIDTAQYIEITRQDNNPYTDDKEVKYELHIPSENAERIE